MPASSTSRPPSASAGRRSAAGLGLRLHAEQLARTGAAELGVRLGAASVDHLEQLDAEGVAAIAGSDTVATLLPAPAIVLRDRLPPARALLDAGATVALASDANAGTYGGFGTMPLVIGLGATLLGMTVTEALTPPRRGGRRCGCQTWAARGRRAADLVAWDAEHEGAFALRLGAVRPIRSGSRRGDRPQRFSASAALEQALGVRMSSRQLLEDLLDLAVGVLLVLGVRLDRLALAGERLEQVVDWLSIGRLDRCRTGSDGCV